MSTGRGDFSDLENLENSIDSSLSSVETKIDACQEDMTTRLEAAFERLGDRFMVGIMLGKWDYRTLDPTQRVKLAEALLEGTSSKVVPR